MDANEETTVETGLGKTTNAVVELIYDNEADTSAMKNVLLIHDGVTDYNTFVNAANSDTFPIVYSNYSSKEALLQLLQQKFVSISRVAFVFHSGEMNPSKMFLDNEPLFTTEDLAGVDNFNNNMKFMIEISNSFQIKNLDFLACNTLQYDAWKTYYLLLNEKTQATIGASDDLTGNLKYGGDWTLESTNEDIKSIYFTDLIENYQYTLITGSISQSGGTIYLRQTTTSSQVEWSTTNLVNSWTTVAWPLTITNTSTTSAILTVQLTTDITFSGTVGGVNGYIIIGSDLITIDGLPSGSVQNKVVTISDITDYPGLVQNGTDGVNGFTNITIQNVGIITPIGSTTTLATEQGWFCQTYFGYDISTGFIKVENCYSTGEINGDYAGGIFGRYPGYQAHGDAQIYAVNCSSRGAISGVSAGGIFGYFAGSDAYGSSKIYAENCSSVGEISGYGAGGIFGRFAGSRAYGSAKIYALNCSSTGDINGISDEPGAGGIFGRRAGSESFGNAKIYAENCNSVGAINCPEAGGIFGYGAGSIAYDNAEIYALNCYSTGVIDGDRAGGIFGSSAGERDLSTVTISAINCYSTGAIGGNNGGIFGSNSGLPDSLESGSPTYLANIYAINCYSTGEISAGGGGIFGAYTKNPDNDGSDPLPEYNISLYATNCYTTGTINGENTGGIFGSNSILDAPPGVLYFYAANCYTIGEIDGTNAGGIYSSTNQATTTANCFASGNNLWADSEAITTIQTDTTNVWLDYSASTNVPWLLKTFNENIYTPPNKKTIEIGTTESSTAGLFVSPDYTYIIYNNQESGISINQSTGVITFTNPTQVGTYVVYVLVGKLTGSVYSVYNSNTYTFVVYAKTTGLATAGTNIIELANAQGLGFNVGNFIQIQNGIISNQTLLIDSFGSIITTTDISNDYPIGSTVEIATDTIIVIEINGVTQYFSRTETIIDGEAIATELGFDVSEIVRVIVGPNVTDILGFTGATILTTVDFTSATSLVTIEDSAFSQSGLTTVNIPATVTSIGIGAFANCIALTSIGVDASNTGYSSQDGVLFDKAITTIIQFPAGKSGPYTIPTTITSIGIGAFAVTTLLSISIPNGVTTIGEAAFFGCASLAAVNLGPESLLVSIGAFAFRDCIALLSITIPNGVTIIGASAFSRCANLAAANIGDESLLETIDEGAFDTTPLLTIRIPNGVTIIGAGAFASCASLAAVNLSNANNLVTISDNAFEACTALSSVTIPFNVTSIGSYAFYECTSLSAIVIPESVTSIGDNAFTSCNTPMSVKWVKPNIDIVLSGDPFIFGNNQGFAVLYYQTTGVGALPATLKPNGDPFLIYPTNSSIAYDATQLTYTLTYFGNGGTEPNPGTVTYNYGSTATVSSETQRIGFTLDGWNTLANGSGTYYAQGSTFTIYTDTNLYARWIPDPYTYEGITYTVNPGNTNTASVTGYDFIVPDVTILSDFTIDLTTYVVTSIADFVFISSTTLLSVTIPGTVISIGESAFGFSTLETVTFSGPSGLRSIGNYAFFNCPSLETIIWANPAAFEVLGTEAFNTFIPSTGSVTYYQTRDSGDLPAVLNPPDGPESVYFGQYVVDYNPAPLCFNKGTEILCLNEETGEEEYILIENLKKGDLVKSYKHGYRKIDIIIHKVMINMPSNQMTCMFKMEKTGSNGLTKDLIVTGGHAVLVDDLGEFKEANKKAFYGNTPKIDGKYLLLSCVSPDFVKLENNDIYTWYHFILENDGDDDRRFGVWANGILSEIPSKNQLIQMGQV